MNNNPSLFQEGSSIQSQVQSQKQEIKTIQSKVNIPLWLFISIMIMKTADCFANLFYVYGDAYTPEDMYKKGYVGGAMIGLTVLISPAAIYFLHQGLLTLKYFFILDTITLAMIAAQVAFFGLMTFYEDHWYFTVLKIGFTLQVFTYSGLFRLMLIRVKWSKWRVISYKLMTFSNTLMFFIQGTYFMYSNWSYTYHLLPSYDSKVRDFMILFIFGLFAWVWEMYKKITDFDFTADLRYIYLIKTLDKQVIKQKQKIITNRRQSYQIIKRLSQEKFMNRNSQIKKSNFIPNRKQRSQFLNMLNIQNSYEAQ